MLDPILASLIGIALAIVVPAISAAVAIAINGTAIAAIGTEKPELFSKLFITIVLSEALAIYGLLIAFMLLSKLPTITTIESGNKALISGTVIAGATVGASIGISQCGASLAGATAEKPETFSSNIIGVILSEALAIYGLLIAFMVMGQI